MEQRVKERLTGAAILVVIVVLLVPALFTGERDTRVSEHAVDPGSPPLQSYTIDLSNTPALADMSAPVESPTVTPVVVAPAPTEAVAVIPVASAPDKTTDQESTRSGWVVQVGSFSKRENAARMVKEAVRKGLRFNIAGPDDRGLYRVRSAVQGSRAAAVELQTKLKDQGYKGLIGTAP